MAARLLLQVDKVDKAFQQFDTLYCNTNANPDPQGSKKEYRVCARRIKPMEWDADGYRRQLSFNQSKVPMLHCLVPRADMSEVWARTRKKNRRRIYLAAADKMLLSPCLSCPSTHPLSYPSTLVPLPAVARRRTPTPHSRRGGQSPKTHLPIANQKQ